MEAQQQQQQQQQTQGDYDYTIDKSRLKLWSMKSLFSFIVLINVGTVDREDNEDNFSKSSKAWGIALSIICFISTLAMIGLHFHQLGAFFLSTKAEGFTILVHILFTTILVGIVSGSSGLGMDENNAVHLGNAYYFSWAAFGVAIALFSNFVNSYLHLDIIQELRERSTSFLYWIALLTSTLVVLGSSSDIYNRNCDVDDKPQPYCNRTIYGIVIGLAGTLFSLLIVAMKVSRGASPFLLEVGSVALLALLFVIGVGLITDVEGPGAPLGNLYYFTWISFGLVLWLSKTLWDDYNTASDMDISGGIAGDNDVTSPSNMRPTEAVFDQHDAVEESDVGGTNDANKAPEVAQV